MSNRQANRGQLPCAAATRLSSVVCAALHALGEQAASWDEVAARFATRFRVVALDLRGHGASNWAATHSFELMRDDVIGVLDDLNLALRI